MKTGRLDQVPGSYFVDLYTESTIVTLTKKSTVVYKSPVLLELERYNLGPKY